MYLTALTSFPSFFTQGWWIARHACMQYAHTGTLKLLTLSFNIP